MTSLDMVKTTLKKEQRYLEYLIPILSFGVTGIGILLWKSGFDLNYQVFSFGCILGSCILAYLAWIRPHRDIVALSTPVYAFIFFLVPSDDLSWIVLQLLYATSLTILLLRLKYRFGNAAPAQGSVEDQGPLDDYIRQVDAQIPQISPALAGDAGMVFIRFAQGEYAPAAHLALTRSRDPALPLDGPLALAFSIAAEQASQTASNIAVPDLFHKFGPEHAKSLFHPIPDSSDREREYTTNLDNALLFLYAVAMLRADDRRRQDVRSFRKFAQKLSGPE
jgi:hypothetical protein